MAELPELDPRAFGIVQQGHCSITLLTEGNLVRTPWVVPQQPLGNQNFQLHESVLKQMALVYGLVDRKPFDETIDQLRAQVEEKDAALAEMVREGEANRWAAERYYASEGAKTAQVTRSRNEQKIAALEDANAELRAKLAKTQVAA